MLKDSMYTNDNRKREADTSTLTSFDFYLSIHKSRMSHHEVLSVGSNVIQAVVQKMKGLNGRELKILKRIHV